MAQQKLLVVITVDEEKLPKGDAYTELPDQLVDTVHRALPGGALELHAVYLLNPSKSAAAKIGALAINYHHYAVNIRGEKCTEESCELHPVQNVLNFNDHKNGIRNSPGLN